MMSKYSRVVSSSARSGTSWADDESSVKRSMSLNRESIVSAARTSRCISAEMLLSVLNRKCGSSCERSASSCADESCAASVEARTSACRAARYHSIAISRTTKINCASTTPNESLTSR